MRLLVAATWLVAGVAGVGCAFEHGQLDSDDPADSPDAGVGPGTGTGSGSGSMPNPTPPVAPRSCSYTVTSDVRLCLEFNDGVLTPKARDASAGQLDATTTKVHMTTRASDPAVAVEFGGSLSIPENTSLDIGSAITLEAWVRSTGPQSATIIGNAGQYVLGMDGSGNVFCSMAGANVSSSNATGYLGDYQWHHIACTFNGQDVQAYLDGSTSDCSRGNGPSISKGGTTGTKIAPNFTGDVDGVRIWAKDLGPSGDICTHAGRTQCQRQCNSGGPPGPPGGDH